VIGRVTVLMLWVPSVLAAQIAPDLLDAPPAELPLCQAPLVGVCYEFTSDSEGWHIPAWSRSAVAHVQPSQPVIYSVPDGSTALRIEAGFPQGRWSAAVLELREIRDLNSYEALVARVRVAAGGQFAVRWAAMVGSRWTWSEVPDATPLRNGQWTEVSVPVEELGTGLAHVRRLILRIEFTGEGEIGGPVAVDIDFIRFVAG